MTVKLGARIEADVSPLVEALATAEQALDQFEGRIGAANDELSRLGDAGTASLGGLADGAGQAADALAPLGAAAEAVQAVAAAAQEGDTAFAAATESSGAAATALAGLLSAVNDNVSGLSTAGAATSDVLDRLGNQGAEALTSLVEPARGASEAVTGMEPAADDASRALAALFDTLGDTGGIDAFARATGEVGDALADLTAGDEELAREAAANQQQLQTLADARQAMGETLRQADRDNADTSREILEQASRIAEDGFAARVNLERQFWTENQGIEEAGGRTALEVMTAALDEQNAVMAEELAKRNQSAREQTQELRTTLDDAFKEYLAPAVGMAGDIAGNNRALVPTGGAMLNRALEQAGYGPADQTWQETVVRTIVDGLETIGATGERAFATLKESGSSALHEIGSEAGAAEQATSSFGTVLEDIGHAASAAVDGLGRLVHDGLQAAEQAFADTGTAAGTAGREVVAATTEVGAGGAAMGREVAEGAEAGGAGLSEMAAVAEGAAIGMAARAGMVGQALRSLGPIGLGAAAAVGVLWLAFDDAKKGEEELTAINQALARTGVAATLTAKDVQTLANQVAAGTMASRAELLQAEQELMQYHTVLGDNFERTLRLSADLSAAFGGSLTSNVKLLGAALDEPEQALENLERAGVRFTDGQRDLIESLVESGRTFEAQQAILDAVAESVGGADATAQHGLTGRIKDLSNAIDQLGAVAANRSDVIGALARVLGYGAGAADGPGLIERGVSVMADTVKSVLNAATDALDETSQRRLDALQAKHDQLIASIEAADQAAVAATERQVEALTANIARLKAEVANGFDQDTTVYRFGWSGIDISSHREQIARDEAEIKRLEDQSADERIAARRRLTEQLAQVDAERTDLAARRRQEELTAEIAAEDQQGRVRAEQAHIVAGQIEEINSDLDDRLNELSATRIDKIREEADAQIRVIEGQRAAAQSLGIDTGAYDAAILKVRQWELAEVARAEATERSTEDTKQAIDPNQKLIGSLQAELDLIGLSNRERSIEQAVRRLSADATGEQRDKVRELATALQDEKAAIEASTRAQQVLGNLRQQLANLNAGAGELAAAQAVKQLGDNASAADKAMASLLAHQLQDGREARQVIDSVRDGAERYEQELNKLNHLLEVGAIDHQTYERAAEQAYERMLAASDSWADGIERGWRRWSEAAYDGAAQAERVFGDAMKGMEDIFVGFITRGELNFDNLTQRIIEDLARIFWEREVMGPIGDAIFGTGDGGGGGFFSDLFGGLFATGAVFETGRVTAFAGGTVIDRPTLFPMATGMGLMGEAGPEGILPLQRLPDGRLGVSAAGIGGGGGLLQATDARATYVVNVDARGASDPDATAALVQRAVAETLGRLVPGIVSQAASTAYGSVVDQLHRRGGKF